MKLSYIVTLFILAHIGSSDASPTPKRDPTPTPKNGTGSARVHSAVCYRLTAASYSTAGFHPLTPPGASHPRWNTTPEVSPSLVSLSRRQSALRVFVLSPETITVHPAACRHGLHELVSKWLFEALLAASDTSTLLSDNHVRQSPGVRRILGERAR